MSEQAGPASPPVWSVVLAAGEAQRFGGVKQFAELHGTSLLDRAMGTAKDATDGVVAVLPGGSEHRGKAADAVVTGGSTRSASVRSGLTAVPGPAQVIVIHDAAHPLASVQLFEAVIGAVRAGAEAAVPGLPVVEALRVVSDGWMHDDLDRSSVALIQMPQAFSARALRSVHAVAPEAVEDSLLVRRSGGRVRVVPGEPANVHVTTRADLELVRAIERGRV